MTFCLVTAEQAGNGFARTKQGLLCESSRTAARETANPSCKKTKTVQVNEKENFFFVGCSNFQKFRSELFYLHLLDKVLTNFTIKRTRLHYQEITGVEKRKTYTLQ